MEVRVNLEDRLALHELVARYGNIIDAFDWPVPPIGP